MSISVDTRRPLWGLPPEQRFLRKLVVQPSGCVTYEGAKQRGYGLFQVSSRVTRIAHRWWWEQLRGDAGETLDEGCCSRLRVRADATRGSRRTS